MSSGACSRTMKGWLAGCGAATAVISTFVLIVSAIVSRGDLTRIMGLNLALLFLALTIFIITCVLTGIPAALVIWLSETFAIRSILFFGGAGAITGALSDGILVGGFTGWPSGTMCLFVVAGFAAGMAYWRVAGKYAGGDREASGSSA